MACQFHFQSNSLRHAWHSPSGIRSLATPSDQPFIVACRSKPSLGHHVTFAGFTRSVDPQWPFSELFSIRVYIVSLWLPSGLSSSHSFSGPNEKLDLIQRQDLQQSSRIDQQVFLGLSITRSDILSDDTRTRVETVDISMWSDVAAGDGQLFRADATEFLWQYLRLWLRKETARHLRRNPNEIQRTDCHVRTVSYDDGNSALNSVLFSERSNSSSDIWWRSKDCNNGTANSIRSNSIDTFSNVSESLGLNRRRQSWFSLHASVSIQCWQSPVEDQRIHRVCQQSESTQTSVIPSIVLFMKCPMSTRSSYDGSASVRSDRFLPSSYWFSGDE